MDIWIIWIKDMQTGTGAGTVKVPTTAGQERKSAMLCLKVKKKVVVEKMMEKRE